MRVKVTMKVEGLRGASLDEHTREMSDLEAALMYLSFQREIPLIPEKLMDALEEELKNGEVDHGHA